MMRYADIADMVTRDATPVASPMPLIITRHAAAIAALRRQERFRCC